VVSGVPTNPTVEVVSVDSILQISTVSSRAVTIHVAVYPWWRSARYRYNTPDTFQTFCLIVVFVFTFPAFVRVLVVQCFCSILVLSFFLFQLLTTTVWGESELIEFHLNGFGELLATTHFVALVIYMIHFYQYLPLTSWVFIMTSRSDYECYISLSLHLSNRGYPRMSFFSETFFSTLRSSWL